MCDAPATGREHVPPKCIFPASSEHRKNLIVVPSCDIHNLRRSKDDELLRHILSLAPGNNDFAFHVVEQGVIPALERRPHIIETFLPNLTELKVDDGETASFTIDLKRFESSIRAIVRGLFYADTEEKLLSDLTVVWGALLTKDRSEAPFLEMIRRREQSLPPMGCGSNPQVFQYDLQDSNDGSGSFCRLRFYEGHPIYVIW